METASKEVVQATKDVNAMSTGRGTHATKVSIQHGGAELRGSQRYRENIIYNEVEVTTMVMIVLLVAEKKKMNEAFCEDDNKSWCCTVTSSDSILFHSLGCDIVDEGSTVFQATALLGNSHDFRVETRRPVSSSNITWHKYGRLLESGNSFHFPTVHMANGTCFKCKVQGPTCEEHNVFCLQVVENWGENFYYLFSLVILMFSLLPPLILN